MLKLTVLTEPLHQAFDSFLYSDQKQQITATAFFHIYILDPAGRTVVIFYPYEGFCSHDGYF